MISFDINRFEIEIKKHASIRAMQRGITFKMIKVAIRSGKIERFGKCNLRFTKNYKNFKLICVDEICGNTIKIVTVVIK